MCITSEFEVQKPGSDPFKFVVVSFQKLKDRAGLKFIVAVFAGDEKFLHARKGVDGSLNNIRQTLYACNGEADFQRFNPTQSPDWTKTFQSFPSELQRELSPK